MKTALMYVVSTAAMMVSWSAHAGLISTDDGLGVYDTTNNVTWTSDANLFATQLAGYGAGPIALVNEIIADSGGVIHETPNPVDPSGTYTLSLYDFSRPGGAMDGWGAQAWVHYLNVTDYGGSNQWALPTTVDSSSSIGFPTGALAYPSQSSSQLAELFYGGLGQVAGSPITSTHSSAYSLFSDVQDASYWSGTVFSANPGVEWIFNTEVGNQGGGSKLLFYDVLAVSPGRISAAAAPEIDAGSMVSAVTLLLGCLAVFGGRRAASLVLR